MRVLWGNHSWLPHQGHGGSIQAAWETNQASSQVIDKEGHQEEGKDDGSTRSAPGGFIAVVNEKHDPRVVLVFAKSPTPGDSPDTSCDRIYHVSINIAAVLPCRDSTQRTLVLQGFPA